FLVPDFRDQRWLDPGMPCVGGDRAGEGRRRTDAALERGAHVLELRVGEPAADSPAVHQLSVLVCAEIERAEPRARALGPREAHAAEVVGPVGPALAPAG